MTAHYQHPGLWDAPPDGRDSDGDRRSAPFRRRPDPDLGAAAGAADCSGFTKATRRYGAAPSGGTPLRDGIRSVLADHGPRGARFADLAHLSNHPANVRKALRLMPDVERLGSGTASRWRLRP